MKNLYKKGITAVELLIILAIVGILVSLVLFQFSKSREEQKGLLISLSRLLWATFYQELLVGMPNTGSDYQLWILDVSKNP